MLAAVGRSYNATVLKGRITETRKPDEKGEHTMRKKILRIMSVLALSMMITGGSLTAFAAEPPVHTCAFSYDHTENYGRITTGSHTITVAIGQTETCYILQDRSAYIYKSACGKTERHYFSNGVSHSNPKCPNH